ncbi:MAG: hypothetical protein JRC86_00580 [Deltaproteobacteria bacterium]|nr:hypothetical protein [Deltaproteobacteria bacterium]
MRNLIAEEWVAAHDIFDADEEGTCYYCGTEDVDLDSGACEDCHEAGKEAVNNDEGCSRRC